MNIAAILALLLASGACSKSDFHTADGATLRVVVCPMTMTGSAPDGAPDGAPEGGPQGGPDGGPQGGPEGTPGGTPRAPLPPRPGEREAMG